MKYTKNKIEGTSQLSVLLVFNVQEFKGRRDVHEISALKSNSRESEAREVWPIPELAWISANADPL